MNVLSLFDGISCGQLALERAGIKVDKYFASEIDKYAIEVTMKNYPDTIQIGDVRGIDYRCLPKIDLLMGGSPCQGFSFAGKQLNFDDHRSALFFEYVKALKTVKPRYFILENVPMKKEYQDVITDLLGVEPMMINSALVSAQNRKRLYWTNISGIEQPEDKGILMEDIIDENFIDEANMMRNKSKTVRTGGRRSPCGSKQEWDNVYKVPVIKSHGELIYKPHKSQCLDANYFKGADNHGQRTGCIEVGHAEMSGHDFPKRMYSPDGKSPTLTAVCGGNQGRKVAVDAKHWRKLTPIECERLQTMPDNYTDCVSNTQRYKMLGNGWTVDVVVHILSYI